MTGAILLNILLWFQRVDLRGFGIRELISESLVYEGLISEGLIYEGLIYEGLVYEELIAMALSLVYTLRCRNDACPRPRPRPCAIGRVPCSRSPLLTYWRIRLAFIPQIGCPCNSIGAASVCLSLIDCLIGVVSLFPCPTLVLLKVKIPPFTSVKAERTGKPSY